jgi:hypothetical protein
MKLSDYTIQRERITLPGKAVDGVKPFFEVRGLCLEDMTFLVQRHLGPITRALKLWQESREDVIRTGNMQQFVLSLVSDFPELAAEVISAAADELDEGATAKARQLPIASQIAALTAISTPVYGRRWWPGKPFGRDAAAPRKRRRRREELTRSAEQELAHFYWGVREDVNYLLELGHADAGRYPLARVWSEARIARRRRVNHIEIDASVMQGVVGSVLSKKGAKQLKDTLKQLRESDGGAS